MRAVAARRLLYAKLKADAYSTIGFGATPPGHGNGGRVELDMIVPGGGTETISGFFLVGADGIGSVVRKAMGVNFDGITIPEIFLTFSTTYDFPTRAGHRQYCLSRRILTNGLCSSVPAGSGARSFRLTLH